MGTKVSVIGSLVTLQFLLPAMLVLTARLSRHNAGYLVLSTVGITLHVWAIRSLGKRNLKVLPRPTADASLITHGPYRYVRHPMYLALLIFSLGFIFMPFVTWKPFAWFALLVVLVMKANIEEWFLRQRFVQYEKYASETWLLLPPIY